MYYGNRSIDFPASLFQEYEQCRKTIPLDPE
jgi:hypothetical protein